jgi:hypothetical protein
VQACEQACDALAQQGMPDLIDLRTLWPWDRAAVLGSCARTGQAAGGARGGAGGAGFGAEIAATRRRRRSLQGAAARCAAHSAVGYAPVLEAQSRVRCGRLYLTAAGKDRERELVVARRLAAVRRRLRRHRHQLGAERLHAGQRLLQRLQVQVAVRAPHAAVEGQHQRAARQQLGGRPGAAVGVVQREGGRLVAGLQRAAGGARGDELPGGAVHGFVDEGGRAPRRAAGFEVGAEGGEFFGQ